MECSSVPYTNKSLVILWLTTLGLFGLTASGAVARPWLPLLLLVALAAPALILRNQDPVPAIARSRHAPENRLRARSVTVGSWRDRCLSVGERRRRTAHGHQRRDS